MFRRQWRNASLCTLQPFNTSFMSTSMAAWTQQDRRHQSTACDSQEWARIRPVIEKLLTVHHAFYNRSKSLAAAKQWKVCVQEGWQPALKPPWHVSWWKRERHHGRIQHDRMIARPSIQESRRLRKQHAPPQCFPSATYQTRCMASWLGNKRAINLAQQFTRCLSTIRSQATARHIKGSPFAAAEAALALDSYSPSESRLFPFDENGGSLLKRMSEKEVSESSTRGWGIAGLTPGSFVEIRRAGHQSTGIFLKMRGADVYYLSYLGSIHLADLNDVMFALHGLVDTSVAESAWPTFDSPLTTTFGIDEDEAQTSARRQCSLALTKLELELEGREALLTEAGAASLHSIYRNESPGRLGQLSTHVAVQSLLGNNAVDARNVYALHRLLMANGEHFIADVRSMRHESRFLVRPAAFLQGVNQVRKWVVGDSNELSRFVDKARKLVDWHRQIPLSPTSAQGSYTPPVQTWTPNELIILGLLASAVGSTRRVQEDKFESLVSAIVKRIGRHDHLSASQVWPPWPLDRFAAGLLLRELGAMAPWQSADLWSEERLLRDFHPPSQNMPTTGQGQNHSKASQQSRYCDPLDDLRTDFADTRVYIIDSPDSQELDDGISITNNTADSAWLHIHVADPTAHVTPSDPVAKQARSRLGSLYEVGMPFSMFPGDWLHSRNISLGSASPEQGNKTLTFSAKVDLETGSIEEYKVEPSIIRNVRIMTYDSVIDVLGEESWPVARPQYLHSGLSSTTAQDAISRSRDQLSATEQADLRLLHQYAEKLRASRVRSGALAWNLPTSEAKIRTAAIQHFQIPQKPMYARVMPIVSLKLPRPWTPHDRVRWSNLDHPIVPELMILAGRLAARFCFEHKIAIPFRGQLPANMDESQLQQLRATQAGGSVDFLTAAKLRFRPVSSFYSTFPSKHQPLGIDDDFGYCRATSPLRRYEDLVVHWQIKTALLPSSSSGTKNRVSLDDVTQLCLDLDRDGKSLTKLQRRISTAWASYIIRDNLHRIEHVPGSADPFAKQLLSNLEALVLQNPSYVRLHHLWSIRMYVPELGMRGNLQMLKPEPWFEGSLESLVGGSDGLDLVGTSVPVKIKNINPEDHLLLELDRSRMHLLRPLL